MNFDNKRIKGALKPFEKVLNFQISQKKKWKSVLFTIHQSKCLYNFENRWAILLENNITRITPKENFLQIFKKKNNYSTRLYEIPKQTSTVILFQELKHFRAKTYYILKCSIFGKNRSFTIISFELQQDLNKACTSLIRY